MLNLPKTKHYQPSKVLPYILIGVGIGAAIHNWIPRNGLYPFLEVRIPLVSYWRLWLVFPCMLTFLVQFYCGGLLAKGAQLGTVLAFMMGVTTLSLPSLIMLRKAIKPKLLACSFCMLDWYYSGRLFVQCIANFYSVGGD